MAHPGRNEHDKDAHEHSEEPGGPVTVRSRVCPPWFKGCEQWLITRTSNAGGIILMITYGYQVKEHNDPLVKIAEDGVDTFSKAALPAAFLVDVFPFRTNTEIFT